MYLFNYTLAQGEFDIHNNSETVVVKPLWITLPSTAKVINVQEICTKN